MKTIFLWTKNEGWMPFTYNILDDIYDELKLRNIIIGENVSIGYSSHIGNNVCIKENTQIGEGVYIWDQTYIGNNVIISDFVSIGSKVYIGNNVHIGNYAVIEEQSSISDDSKHITSIFISGSKYPINYWGDDNIQIGYRIHSLNDWKKYFESFAIYDNYTEEQTKEYKTYIDLLLTFSKLKCN